MVAALNLMFFVIIMVVLGIGMLIVIVALKEDGIFFLTVRIDPQARYAVFPGWSRCVFS